MPAPIVFRDDSLSQGISQAGSALGQALATRGKRHKQQEAMGAFQKGIQDLGPNPTPMEYLGVLNQALKSDVDPSALQAATGVLQPSFKEQARTQAGQQFLQQMGLLPTPQEGPAAQVAPQPGQAAQGDSPRDDDSPP